jgi:hypothetical protein
MLLKFLQGPMGYIIKMTIDGLHMAYNPDTLRCYHWLEIQYNLPGQPGIRYTNMHDLYMSVVVFAVDN